MPGKTYLNVPPFTTVFRGFEGPMCVSKGPTSPTVEAHPEWVGSETKNPQRVEAWGGRQGKGWSLGFGP